MIYYKFIKFATFLPNIYNFYILRYYTLGEKMKKYILTKKDLKRFLDKELKIITKFCRKWFLRFCPILIYEEQIKYKFIKTLRKTEYYTNTNQKLRGWYYRSNL